MAGSGHSSRPTLERSRRVLAGLSAEQAEPIEADFEELVQLALRYRKQREEARRRLRRAEEGTRRTQEETEKVGALLRDRVARLEQESRDLTNTLEALTEVILGSQNDQELFEAGLRASRRITRATRVVFPIWDSAEPERLLRVLGDPLESEGSLSRGIMNEVRRTGRALYIPDAVNDTRMSNFDSVMQNNLRTVFCVPLGAGDRVMGMLYLEHRGRHDAFSDTQRQAVEAVFRILASRLRLSELERSRENEPTAKWRRGGRFQELVGRSRAMADLLEQLTWIIDNDLDSNVLITGETGTGKTMVARSLHRWSSRSTRPFIHVNCTNITDDLLESRLFGHRRGAFTGAVDTQRGYIEDAADGVMLLDEVGEMPPHLQARLLKVLSEGTYSRVGETTSRKARCWFIFATNVDLEQAVKDGLFRSDLYFRIRSLELRLPPLSQRTEDIELIARAVLRRLRESGRRVPSRIGPEALRRLEQARWQGNVRELVNLVELAARGCAEDVLEVEHLTRGPLGSLEASSTGGLVPDLALSWKDANHRFQRQLLLRHLSREGVPLRDLARSLGLNRTYLYKLAERLSIDLKGNR